jgi:hypothetical protein
MMTSRQFSYDKAIELMLELFYQLNDATMHCSMLEICIYEAC